MVTAQELLEGLILKLPERTQSTASDETTQSSENSVKYLLRTTAFQARWSNRGQIYPPTLNR